MIGMTSKREPASSKPPKAPKEVKPRPRRRRGKGLHHEPTEIQTRIQIMDSGPNYQPIRLGWNPPHQKGVSIRNSTRWYDSMKLPCGPFRVPYYDKLGFDTGHELYSWACDPRQLVATCISTVARRLESHARRHNSEYIVRANARRLVQAATVFVLTKNTYLWDRILCFTRRLATHGKLIHRLSLSFLCKADESIRFVYSQVCLQTNWLLFRAERPRDKSVQGKGNRIRKDPIPDTVSRSITILEIAQAISGICNLYAKRKPNPHC